MSSQHQPETDPSSGASPARQAATEALDFQIQHLLVAVEHELRRNATGISELNLIKTLQRPPWQLLGKVDFSVPEKLYPVHFLLFHVLYQLRDQVASHGETLSISPLLIRLHPADVVAGSGLVAEADSLRAFYLDLTQYELPEDAIHRMMDDFWSGQTGYRPAREETAEAATVLGFDQVPEHFGEVKQRFRRAVMQAHPDRGGDTEQVQGLNQAFAVLKAHFHN